MEKPNGIPILGLGTYPLQDDEATRTVETALDLGFRHIDTAQMYGNEKAVGRAITQSLIPRAELFIVTKIDPSNLSEDRMLKSAQTSIADLGGPVNLLLIHWPPADTEIAATVDRLMLCKERGLAKAIGVSNFNSKMMRQAQAISGGAIINNQVEFHPLLDQQELLKTAKELGIVLSAYSPLARGAAMQPAAIQAIAKTHNRPASEIVLRWITQQGVCAIPMTTKRENAASNLRCLDFMLTALEMATITKLGTKSGRTIAPGWMTGRWDE